MSDERRMASQGEAEVPTAGGLSEEHKGAARGPGSGPFDREINVRRILAIGGWLAALALVAHLAMWLLYRALETRERKLDPLPPPVAEALVPRQPPEPRLQTTPEIDLARLRAKEEAVLRTYGWVDQNAGIARLPIDRALELTLLHGLPLATEEVHAAPAPTP